MSSILRTQHSWTRHLRNETFLLQCGQPASYLISDAAERLRQDPNGRMSILSISCWPRVDRAQRSIAWFGTFDGRHEPAG